MPLLRDKQKRLNMRAELYRRLDAEGVELSVATSELRKILGLSQAQFAEKVGISLSTLRKIEQESGNVTLETLARIFDMFDLRLVVKRQGAPATQQAVNTNT